MQHIGSMSGSGSITSARSADLLKRVNALLNDCTVIIADDLALESTVTQRHYCSLILDGLALMRARQLGVSVERIYVAPNVTHTESGSSNDEVLSPPFKIRTPLEKPYSASRDATSPCHSRPKSAASISLDYALSSSRSQDLSHSDRVLLFPHHGKPQLGTTLTPDIRNFTECGSPVAETLGGVSELECEEVASDPPSFKLPAPLTCEWCEAPATCCCECCGEFCDACFTDKHRRGKSKQHARLPLADIHADALTLDTSFRWGNSSTCSFSSFEPVSFIAPCTVSCAPIAVEQWQNTKWSFRVLFLNAIFFETSSSDSVITHGTTQRFSVPDSESAVPDTVPGSQALFAILFADIVGYSKMDERQVKGFINCVLKSFRLLLENLSSSQRVAYPNDSNSWGDALYFVFSSVADAGATALLLSDHVRRTPWHVYGMPSNLNIRISLHAAPLLKAQNPFSSEVRL